MDIEKLKNAYYKKTNSNAAKEMGVSVPTLLKMIDKAGIERKGSGRPYDNNRSIFDNSELTIISNIMFDRFGNEEMMSGQGFKEYLSCFLSKEIPIDYSMLKNNANNEDCFYGFLVSSVEYFGNIEQKRIEDTYHIFGDKYKLPEGYINISERIK